jgi:hypothetical protein
MDRRYCQVKAAGAVVPRNEELIDLAVRRCQCWRCQEWRVRFKTPEYRNAILLGIQQGLSQRQFTGSS